MTQALRKKLSYQLAYRGTKELDRLMAEVRETILPHLPDDQLPALEAFLQIPEPELTAILFGQAPLPPALPEALSAKLRQIL